MNRKKIILPLLLMFVALVVGGATFGFGNKTSKLKAEPVVSSDNTRAFDDDTNPENPTQWQGEYNQVGKLRYGLVRTRVPFKKGGNEYFVSSPSVELIPDDAYVNGQIKESKVIRHIFDGQLYKVGNNQIEKNTRTDKYKRDLGTSYGLTILEDEAANKFMWSVSSQPNVQANFFGGKVSGNEVKGSGTTEEDFSSSSSLTDFDKWNVDITMTPNSNESAILHTYTVTNKSGSTKTFTPIKFVDTQLDYNDFVQVFSRGPGRGVYIETYEDSIPAPTRPKGEGRNARLDYIVDPNRKTDPVQYSGNALTFIDGVDSGSDRKFSNGYNLFGELGATTPIQRVIDEMSAAEGTPIFGWDGVSPLTTQNAIDTAIYLNWGQKTLADGESVTLTYEVGMKELTKMDLDKTYENLNNHLDGKNYVGDEIKYDIKVGAPEYQVNKLVVTDKLSWNFEKPDPDSIVSVTSGKTSPGTPVATYKMSEVFDENPNPSISNPYVGTLTIPKGGAATIDLPEGGEYHYSFSVKLAKRASGQSVLNKANITGVTPEQQKVFGEAETKTPIKVANIGKVIIKYQDTTGKEIAKTDEISGNVDSDYDLTIDKEIPIDGYQFKEYLGNAKGKITVADQTVILRYDENFFTLTQDVKKAGGVSGLSVAPDDKLDYTVTLNSLLKDVPGRTYDAFTITAKIEGVIEDLKDFKLVSSLNTGVALTTPIYDPATKTITATVPAGIPSHAGLILTYSGKVLSTVSIGETIKAEAKAGGTYSDSLTASEVKATDLVSTVSSGNLTFESAPGTMNFGGNLDISLLDKTYPLVSRDKELTVKDLRGATKEWSMVAKVTEVLTNKGNGNHQLPNALYYKRDGVEYPMPLNGIVFVKSHKTVSGASVDISADWNQDKNKPFVKVKGGEAKKGAYTGTIEWILRDGPTTP